MSEFTIGSHTYRATNLDARTAFHVARRFTPVLMGLATIKRSGQTLPPPERFGQAMALVSGQLPQADVDYVLDMCLGSVQRRQDDGSWAPVRASNGRLMFEDIDLNGQLQIVWRVAEANGLVDFFYIPPDALPDLPQPN